MALAGDCLAHSCKLFIDLFERGANVGENSARVQLADDRARGSGRGGLGLNHCDHGDQDNADQKGDT